MKNRLLLFSLIISVILACTIASFAQQTAKIVVINASRAFESSAEGKKAIAQFQARESKIRADIQKLDDAVLALQNRLSTARLTMTPEALQGLQADLDRRTIERKRYQEDASREYGAFRENLGNRIKAEMVAIIQSLRKEKGYDIVLDLVSSGVVDFEPALDITDEVIRRYDASKTAAPSVKK